MDSKLPRLVYFGLEIWVCSIFHLCNDKSKLMCTRQKKPGKHGRKKKKVSEKNAFFSPVCDKPTPKAQAATLS